MKETIGKVTLDYSKYPGEDYYCDGAVEDELLEIVKTYPAKEYRNVIQERKKWPVLYHLSALRENIVEWLPITKTDKVLEVGSGCGAITGALAKKAGEVTSVDLSKKRSLINAYRHSDCDNVTIHVGNFKDIEPDLGTDYQYICLIGVFEYGQSYIGGEAPYEDFLRILMRHLAPGGRIVIAIENKYGLKYFAGCMEDHLGSYFSGIENYASGGGVRTFGRGGLEKIFAACGVKESHFYYPYPDYKFMTTLYSDKRLPQRGELSNNLRNFDRDRMVLFHEKDAYDGMLEEGLFPVFSNSYMVILGEDMPVEYARYSNDRAEKYQIKTQIERRDGFGPGGEAGDMQERDGRVVIKAPLHEAAIPHVQGMLESYEALTERYKGTDLAINHCRAEKDAVAFEYVQGTLLSDLLDGCLARGDEEGFMALIRTFAAKIGYGSDCNVSDMDPVFSNVLVDGDRWTLIDYEWTFEKKTEAKELLYRALHCYLMEDAKREKLPMERILAEHGISKEEAERIRGEEAQFQKFVTQGARAMAEIREDIGCRVTYPVKWVNRLQESAGVSCVQIYSDRGQGYSEADSYFVKDAYQSENLVEFEINVPADVRLLRVDPAMDACLVRVQELLWNGVSVDVCRKRLVVTNGLVCREKTAGRGKSAAGRGKNAGDVCVKAPCILFDTKDPNINIRVERLPQAAAGTSAAGGNVLKVKLEVVRIP